MSQPGEVPHISSFTLRFFRSIVRSYFRRHFRAVQVQHFEKLASAKEGPLIVYGNHSSWWDPMLITLLASVYLPHRRHYAPMADEQLVRYPILRKIGIFPVAMRSSRGAAEFLSTAQAILNSGGVLWITPQARFADVRERPLRFKAGLAMLALRVPGVQLLPLAAEYTFWDERLPETLGRFGDPLRVPGDATVESATAQLEAALEQSMDELREAAKTRDFRQFATVLSGRRGTGGFYGVRQMFGSWVGGKKHFRDHTPRERDGGDAE
jgi:1-acyl-sn-glycerol-3-phosphate acyltransferase